MNAKLMEKLPIGLLCGYCLVDVPQRYYADALWSLAKAQSNKAQKKQSDKGFSLFGRKSDKKESPNKTQQFLDLDVSLWVRCSFAPERPIGLVMRYTDANGEHAVLVDEEDTQGGLSALLSSRIRLPYEGWVDNMALHCTGSSKKHSLHAESWHVKRITDVPQESWA